MSNHKHNNTTLRKMQYHPRKYRAKAIQPEHEAGEWVEGYYVCLDGTEHRIYNGYAEIDCGDYYPDWRRVDPTTLGQDTGQTDKYGARIYEGDIVEINSARGVFMFGAVSYNEVVSSYEIKNRERDSEMTFFPSELHVVGNIYDNPGLMGKGGEK